jgi:hypothetical protein
VAQSARYFSLQIFEKNFPPPEQQQGVPTMAAMKPRTGDGPMEVTKEARSLVMRIPLEGGGRLVVELNPQEANNLSAALEAAVALIKK